MPESSGLPSPSPPSKPSAEVFSIAVVGAMNPAIHHPFWYQHHDLISEAEVTEAIASTMICTPLLAHFQFGSCQLVCTQERWSLSASLPSERQRVLSITARAFDDLLGETPVYFFAFDNDVHLQTSLQDVRRALLAWLPNGLSSLPGAEAANLRLLVRSPDGGDVNIRVEPSVRSASEVFVGVNSNHRAPAGEFHFSLRTLLDRFHEPDRQASAQYASAVLEALANLKR